MQCLIDAHNAATATVEQAKEKGRALAREKALKRENELKLALAKVAITLKKEIQALEDELIKRTQQVEELESDLEDYDSVTKNLEELERSSQAIETHNREQQARIETLQ
jgi:Cft2 family RNA processing exonuclease